MRHISFSYYKQFVCVCVFLNVYYLFAITKPECPRCQCQPNPWIQGGGHPEVALHPSSLRHLQGRVGLADPAGYLLCGHHRALQCLLYCCRDTGGRRLGGTQSSQCERHLGGDPLHYRYWDFPKASHWTRKWFKCSWAQFHFAKDMSCNMECLLVSLL